MLTEVFTVPLSLASNLFLVMLEWHLLKVRVLENKAKSSKPGFFQSGLESTKLALLCLFCRKEILQAKFTRSIGLPFQEIF